MSREIGEKYRSFQTLLVNQNETQDKILSGGFCYNGCIGYLESSLDSVARNPHLLPPKSQVPSVPIETS